MGWWGKQVQTFLLKGSKNIKSTAIPSVKIFVVYKYLTITYYVRGTMLRQYSV